MPLHDVGYREWDGAKMSARWRWWVIAVVCVQLAFRSSWLGRTLIISWIPAIALGAGFFAYEQSLAHPEMRRTAVQVLRLAGASPQLIRTARADPEAARHQIWSALLLVFFRYPQAILMLIVVGIVAPRLISADLRNRAYLLYFARPIRISEYILGKALTVWTFLALITTAPALVLYLVGLALSPDLHVALVTWDLPLRILVASVVLMLPTTAIALACSAMTIDSHRGRIIRREMAVGIVNGLIFSRQAAFTWFALWIVGWVAYSILSVGELASQPPTYGGDRDPVWRAMNFISRWELISPYHLLGRVQQWVFGLYPPDRSIAPHMSVLATVTVVGYWMIHRRLRSRLSE